MYSVSTGQRFCRCWGDQLQCVYAAVTDSVGDAVNLGSGYCVTLAESGPVAVHIRQSLADGVAVGGGDSESSCFAV